MTIVPSWFSFSRHFQQSLIMKVSARVRQGSTLSPLLFSVMDISVSCKYYVFAAHTDDALPPGLFIYTEDIALEDTQKEIIERQEGKICLRMGV